VIGDSGFGQPVTAKLAEQMAGYPLDFVIHTGDVVYNAGANANPAEAFALKYFQPFSPLLHQLPIYAVPGNHEYAQDARIEGVPYYYHVFPPLADPSHAGPSPSGQSGSTMQLSIRTFSLSSWIRRSILVNLARRSKRSGWISA